LDQFTSAILSSSEDIIETSIKADERTAFRDEILSLGREGAFSAFYAPFDWTNEDADIVIVGVTPGKQQALEALLTYRRALLAKHTQLEAARLAKGAASFKGGMRILGARLMDHFGLHKIFGLNTTYELFERASQRAHYTSALRYPVLKDYSNYSGDKSILKRRLMANMIYTCLAEELRRFPNAWVVPFGPTAHLALVALAARGIVDDDRILGGILHPGGQQWNRYNVQLDLVDEATAAGVPGGIEVRRRSAELRAKIKHLQSIRVSA
jgi:hypothetical protein